MLVAARGRFDERDRFDAIEDIGAIFLGVLGHQAVQVKARNGVAVVGKHGVFWPVHVELGAKAEAAQALIAVTICGHDTLEAHLGQLVDRARGEAIATGLLAGEVLLLDQAH